MLVCKKEIKGEINVPNWLNKTAHQETFIFSLFTLFSSNTKWHLKFNINIKMAF